MLKRSGKSAAHHFAQNVKDHDIGVFKQVVLFEQFDRLADHIAAAACARRWTTRFDAHHAVIAFEHIVVRTQLFAVKFNGFEDVDNRRHQLFCERERAVMLGIAANLQHTVPQFRERGGEV